MSPNLHENISSMQAGIMNVLFINVSLALRTVLAQNV